MLCEKKQTYLEQEYTGDIHYSSIIRFKIKQILKPRRPVVLRKRKQVISEEDSNAKPIEINTEATGIELHKDSKYDQLFPQP